MITDDKLNEIRDRLDQQFVAAVLEHAGYEISRSYKFRLRGDESTPSASIRKDGYIKDFGGDYGGDIIGLLQQYHGLSFKESILYVATCMGVAL